MNKHGFTLIEVLCVVAIMALLAIAVETNFFNLIGSRNEYENKELFNYLNTAALMYENVEEGKNCSNYNNCIIKVDDLLTAGYIENSFNLLRGSGDSPIKGDFKTECLGSKADNCKIKITKVNNERKACVCKYNVDGTNYAKKDYASEGYCTSTCS